MIINSITADGYKNLENVCIELDPKMNIICGENAQGKTNLIEAVWLCSGCRSFRGTREKDFIGFTKDAAKVGIIFSDNERKQEISFSVKKENPKEKTVNLNGVKLPLLSKLFGSFRCVVFTPEDLDLTKGTPDVRRHFLDLSISQIKPSYINALNKYNTILSHRNALLKSINNLNDEDESCLDIWNEQIAEAGAYISVLRYNFCLLLNEYTKQLYSSVTDGKEKLKTGYHSTVYEALDGEKDIKGKLKEIYLKKLRSSITTDLKLGFTSAGIHRDDLKININDLPVREFGSQGQARSAALSLKLAHARILKEEYGEDPVMLLDDVLSELDPMRQRFILNNIEDMQVLITCCDSKFITDMRGGKVFIMKKGRIC